MIYSTYGIIQQSYDYNPYKIDNTTVSGYNVPTHNGNNTNR